MIFVCIKLVFHVGSLECALKATTIAPENWMVGPMKKYVPFWGGGRDKTAYFQIGGIDHQFSGDGKWTLHFIFLSYRSFRFGLKESTNQTSPKIPSKTLRPDRPLSKVPPRPENGVLIFWKAKIWLEIHPFVSTEPWKPPWLWEGKVSTSISTTQSWLLK